MIHLLSQLDRIYRMWLSESERINGDQDVLYSRENLIVLFKRWYVWLGPAGNMHVDNGQVYRRREFQSEDEAREGCKKLASEYDGKARFAERQQYECQMRLYLKTRYAIIVEALEAKVEAKNAEVEALNAIVEAKNTEIEALNAKMEALDAKVKVLNAKVEALDAKVKVLLVPTKFRNVYMLKEFMNEPLIPNPDNEIKLSWLEAVKHQYRAGAQFYRELVKYSLARFPSIMEQGALLTNFYETIACEQKAKVLEYKKKMYYSFQAHERETYAREICVEADKADKCQAYVNWFRYRQEMEALQEVVQEVEEMLAKREKLGKIKKLDKTEIDQPIYLIVLKVVLHYFLPLPSALQDLCAQFSSCFPLRE
jgi:hypothetical protein